MDRKITRRDFCNGVSTALLAAGFGAWPAGGGRAAEKSAQAEYYPPALTGLRGSHAGSFEVAHALAREGRSWDSPADSSEATYDLIVVGGGVSGLAAAYFYRQRAGAKSRILILDNHDDFGGHAKRNEFRAGSRLLIGYGGSQSIDRPSAYSQVAKQLLVDLGVRTEKFYQAYDQEFFESQGLDEGVFFDRATYGEDRLVVGSRLHSFRGSLPVGPETADYVEKLPISQASKKQLQAILTKEPEGLGGRGAEQVVPQLKRVSYNDYLRARFGANAEVMGLFQRRFSGFWGLGTDGVSALEALRAGFPGFTGLGIRACETEGAYADCDGGEPYIFHFPDGNASVARLLVRSLIPGACPGDTMEDIVTARMDYGRLDAADAAIRIRLSATAVRVVNAPLQSAGDGVAVTYVRHGAARLARARHAILACYNGIVPYLCPELPPEQSEALGYGVKVPLVYVNALIRSWQPFKALGVHRVFFPSGFYPSVSMDFPVSLGSYAYPKDPSEPMLLHLTHVPTFPGRGLNARQQHRLGHHALLSMAFEDYERPVRTQLNALLGPVGFDAARDILAITANRWPHGYTYEYNDLFDPEWDEDAAPHEIGRRKLGRISIANSDAGASAYLDAAIDQAHRAVAETLEG